MVDKKKHHLTKASKKYSHEHERAQKEKSDTVLHKKQNAEKGGKKHHSVDADNHHASKHIENAGAHGAAYKHGDKQKKSGFVKVFSLVYNR